MVFGFDFECVDDFGGIGWGGGDDVGWVEVVVFVVV